MKKLRANRLVTFLGAGIVALALTGGAVWQLAPAFTAGERAELVAIRADAQDILTRVDRLLATTTTTAPTTTTTSRPTTTTRPPTTTTPPTTTQPPTTQPPTTTTQPGIPATINHGGINSENGYRIGVIDRSGGSGVGLWSANYHHELLYQPNTGWRNGDRIAYHCAYGFITDNGVIVGRFTFRAVPNADTPGGAYIQINDTYMEDAPNSPQDTAGGPSRYYDGSQRPAGIQSPFADCPQDVGIDYEAGNFPDEDPIIPFWNDGQVIEIRDYRNLVPAAGVTFDELAPITQPFQITTSTGTHTVNDRRTVLARLNGVPVAVVYYDGLNSGSMFP